MTTNRVIEHGSRAGFGSLASGGLRMDSFPMKLLQKGNDKFWQPADIDFSKDAADFAAMSPDEKQLTCTMAAHFMAGEESVAQDLQPFLTAMAAEGRLADEAYLTQFLFEETKHMQSFRMWFEAVGLTEDLHPYVDYSEPYRTIFYEELPASLYALSVDPSPAAQIRASVTYNHIVEGTLALISRIFDQFPDGVPFGIDLDEMTEYAMDKVTRRLKAIESARGRDVADIDEDYTPMRLEATFDDVAEDLRAQLQNEQTLNAWRDWLAERIRAADVAYADQYRPDNPDAPPNLEPGPGNQQQPQPRQPDPDGE
ncbi:Ribonucleotide reductase, small chain [Haloechinothrix alba]|uniref:Ribonucleotide reductase, small chain n=1 Tax=Haloechinothrix alba TaxID=664784 RepID=A0A238WTB7_9PSEU|nr:Ribonucleotide reductase, small chain [Haloechinothrix alba]